MVMTDRVLDFDKDNLDVALRATRRLPDSDLVAHKLFDTSLVFVASPAYLRAHRAPERLEDLAEHRVAFQGSTRARRKIEVSRPGARTPSVLEVRPALGSSDFAFVREMALAGGFLGIVPRLLVAEDVAAGRLVQLLAGYPVEGSSLYLLHRPARFLAPKVRVFVEHMQTDCLARRAAAQPSGRLART
jgi:DNA-binding transcriptional LysR family regulator